MSGRPSYEQLFWSKVDKTGECWSWTASTRGPGYGQCTIAHRKQGYAHRFAWEMVNGPIPPGMHVDHICLNRLCVRLEHLRLATPKQNAEHHAGAYRNSKTGVRGVVWREDKNGYVAQVRHNGATLYLGLFSNLRDAERAAKQARLDLFTHNDVDRGAA